MKKLFFLVCVGLLIYSYCLIDPNITFFSHPSWTAFRNFVVNIGYYQRELSWNIFFAITILLFFFHSRLVKNYKTHKPLTMAFSIGAILLLSYPFLSHDFFNYLFDAKILTHYHQNPYLHKALDFPADHWLRFMHWTHRTYPYGPTWLILTVVPSFISFSKFILNFFFFKIFFVGAYILTTYYLQKIDKKSAVFFATNPLVLIEGLASSHNDIVAVCLGIIGIYYLSNSKSLKGRVLLLASAGIKFITLPIIFLQKKQSSMWNYFIFGLMISLIIYLSISGEVQPWYFLNLFIFLPYFYPFISRLNIFFAGLLLSYYPYIRLGGWDTAEKVILKHNIIIIFLVINILVEIILTVPFRKFLRIKHQPG